MPYYFTLPSGISLPADLGKVALTTGCELHRDDSAVPNALTVANGEYNTFVASNPTLATAASAFTPASLTPSAWYDPSDLSTLWQNDDGTNQVTTDGQSVGRIDDKSGNAKHLTQATSAQRPIYKTSGGLHWLEFDGAGADADSLAGSTLVPVADPVHMVVAGRVLTASVNDAFAYFGPYFASTGAGRSVGLEDASNFKIDSFALAVNIAATVTNDNIVEGIFAAGGTNSVDAVRAAVNGGSIVSMGSAGTIANIGDTDFRLGIGPALSALHCRIYGVVIRNSEITGSNRSDLVTWLNGKAGL